MDTTRISETYTKDFQKAMESVIERSKVGGLRLGEKTLIPEDYQFWHGVDVNYQPTHTVQNLQDAGYTGLSYTVCSNARPTVSLNAAAVLNESKTGNFG